MKNMKNISKKNLVFIALLAVFAIVVLAWFTPLQRTAGVHIVSDVGISQGAVENNSEMESIKVHGTFWNEGDIIAKNLTATVIFTDAAHNKVVRKKVPVGGDLLANKGQIMEFDSEYIRERTLPKTVVHVTIRFDWMENGQLKTTETFLSGGESDSGNNNIGKFNYGNATVQSIEIMVLESFPVQIKVNARGYLLDGCTRIDKITTEKKDNTFLVRINTVRPADTFCTEVIAPFQELISLDVYGLKAGIYIVDVNGINGTFELVTDNIVRE
jgi:inhibitor of cysteine peptidase